MKKFFPHIVNKGMTVIPLISVVAIIIIVSAVVSANVSSITSSGLLIFIAVMLHNAFGFCSDI